MRACKHGGRRAEHMFTYQDVMPYANPSAPRVLIAQNVHFHMITGVSRREEVMSRERRSPRGLTERHA